MKSHRQYIVLAAIIGLGLLLFFSLKGFINAFLGATLFYVLLRNWMIVLVYKRKWSKGAAASVLMIASFLVILLPIALTSMLLYNKVKDVIEHSEEVTQTFITLTHKAEAMLGTQLNSAELLKKSSGYIQVLITSVLNESVSVLGTMAMMYFFLYFLLTNVRDLEKHLMKLMPFSRNTSIQFGSELLSMTYSTAIGLPVIAVIQGICALIAFLITGCPEPFFWAAITALVSVVPVVGTALVWLPMGIYLIGINQTWQGIVVLIFGAIILSNVDNVVRFFIQKKYSDVHPIVTFLGVFAGLHYFGLPGLLFGPLMISWFILLVKNYQQEFVNSEK